MKARILWIVAGVTLAITLSVVLRVSSTVGQRPAPGVRLSESTAVSPPLANPLEKLDAEGASGTESRTAGDSQVADVTALVLDAAQELRNAAGRPEKCRAILARLRARLLSLPEELAVQPILAFLNSGEDVGTGLPFVVGPEGVMATVPTLRVFFLDLLPTLDPEAALENSRDILARLESPDEHALALRNLAWNDLDGDLRPEVALHFQQMLEMDAWRAGPTRGFLEAFDIAVELGDATRFGALSGVAQDAIATRNEPLSRAAFMALDRMTLRNPELLTDAVTDRPDWLSEAPLQRASLVSRLDITRSTERDAFVSYLSRPDLAESELALFASLFPNGNYLTGHRLVTVEEPTLTIDQRLELDRRILGEFENLAPRLPADRQVIVRKIRDRLVLLTDP